MFAKLLSVLSVKYVLRPERQYLHYDQLPNDSLEWRCACKLATCVQTDLRTRLGSRSLESPIDPHDRYASDKLGRCANAQLDVLRIDLLARRGGLLLDLDVFALRSLEPWLECARQRTVLGRDAFGQLDSGVVLAPPGAPFLRRWRSSFRDSDPSRTEFGRCNVSTALAYANPLEVLLTPDLGPLPHYASKAAYDQHIDRAYVAHLSAFRHAWRLRDIMRSRHLERIWPIVAAAVNRSTADDPLRQDAEMRQCLEKVAGACWARPGGKCGIYGA
jgi:hypothetical protein